MNWYTAQGRAAKTLIVLFVFVIFSPFMIHSTASAVGPKVWETTQGSKDQLMEAVPIRQDTGEEERASVLRDLGFFILGVAFTFLALLLEKAIDFRIAKESGALDKPELVLKFFSTDLEPKALRTAWCIIHPGTETDIALVPFAFQVLNNGDATCEEAILTIHVPTMCFVDESRGVSVKFEVAPKLHKKRIMRTAERVGSRAVIAYSLPPIHPNSEVSLQEWFSISPTIVPYSVDMQLGETGMRVGGYVVFVLSFAITLTAKNLAPLQRTLEIESISAVSLDEGVRLYQNVRRSKGNNLSGAASFLRRLLRRSEREPELIIFLAMDMDATHEIDGRTLYQAKDPETGELKVTGRPVMVK